MTILKDGATLDPKLLYAHVAFMEFGARRLAVQGSDAVLIRVFAIQSHRTIGPDKRLDMRISAGFVLKMCSVEYGSDVNLRDGRGLGFQPSCVK